ncbi:DUF6298 domain-containing protein [Armatimonas rosea]|uniref:DUF6298 domain-containing protein n=1 Tax=Armatimonas rosea TaxID=685828 RepID=A0A7W9SQ57_ARMRO|nr:DUF6298 domain-containing protein [Armatimonas rosea]MBB6050780.1 hypothetical protein [Armatimonas rosea]
MPERFVDLGPDGKLVYETDSRGNRVPDFSYAGYQGGGIALPNPKPTQTLKPAPGDSTARIQAALDRGGVILLLPGRYKIKGQLLIWRSGTILRGTGAQTTLVATGTGRRTLIEVRGHPPLDSSWPIHTVTDAYVPVNATKLTLDTTVGLSVDSQIKIRRPSPKAWLERIGMASVPGRPAPGWAADKMNVVWERSIVAIGGNTLTLDAPLTCALERELGGAVVQFTLPRRVSECGVEHLILESEWDKDNPHDEEHSWQAIALEYAEDCWVKNSVARHFVSSAVRVGEESRRITVQDCACLAPVSEVAGYRRHAFYTAGQQTLFLRCRSEDARHDFCVGWLAAGPNAFVRCQTKNSHSFSGPIESWATGVLFDNLEMDGGGLAFDNRELWDNGVGWAAANCLAWQCTVPLLTARTPPGAQNWVIGCWAQFVGDGLWRAPNEFVKPESLYEAQLKERQPIPAPPDPRPLSSGWGRPSPPQGGVRGERLTLAHGQLLVGGKPLQGKQRALTFWRGHLQLGRADDVGLHLTRFSPGKTEPVEALIEDMLAKDQVALRHNYGLWYDRRRDDHEMIRRVDAEAFAPFLEQPFARSGKGTSWNGLSRYDLEKYNPWYFGRLKEFARLAEQSGLVLIASMYFQHNILEAGAHWADCPWRPVNNINNTGFPEPPPYAGKKRIFMAKAFYDETHPVRRRLHQRFIRHHLDVLADCPNVIFLLSEEFSGPLHFTQFWLETIAQWRRETKKRVLIGLSAPKDVQDAILASPKYAAQVDVIDFKYWWRAGSNLFAPKGDQDLAPRQHEREYKGKRPDSVDLAAMAAEYKKRFPEKAILSDFGNIQLLGGSH